MECPILLELLQLKECINAEHERHEEAVKKLLQQSEEREVAGRRHYNVHPTGRSKRMPFKFKLKPGNDFNTFCEVVENDSITSSTVQQRLLLRAAFQMLAEREALKCRNGQKILLEGTLRKASKHKMSMGSVNQSTGVWKSKYVQVMGGALVYADLHNNGRLGKAKKLRLYRQKYSCSPLSEVQRDQLLDGKTAAFNEKNSSGNNSSGMSPTRRHQFDQSKLLDLHCFQLVDSGGKRRIWCADSHQECFQWVEAVIRAMVDAPPRRWPQSPSREQLSRSKSLEFAEDAVTADVLTSPYLLDKYRYTSIRSSLKSVSTVSKYLEELNRLGTGTQVAFQATYLTCS